MPAETADWPLRQNQRPRKSCSLFFIAFKMNSGNLRLKCITCDIFFDTVNQFSNHQSVIHGKNWFEFPLCTENENFRFNRLNLRSHILQLHPQLYFSRICKCHVEHLQVSCWWDGWSKASSKPYKKSYKVLLHFMQHLVLEKLLMYLTIIEKMNTIQKVKNNDTLSYVQLTKKGFQNNFHQMPWFVWMKFLVFLRSH